ncbi:MAG TPA: oligosaccharide flippase family protein [Acidobacteriaceae bacterium]|nr:oligosaccharide flippase family protein [Acidobacteriaceae bacterium]
MAHGLSGRSGSLRARIVAGSAVLLSGSTLATVLSLLYNIVIARYLGPQGYGQATVVYTILTFVSALTLSFQIIVAKVVAQQTTEEGKSAAYRHLNRDAWMCALLVGIALMLFRHEIADYLQVSTLLIDLMAVGCVFYLPLGTRRGFIQGAYGFRSFAMNVVLEAAVRLVGSFIMVLLGTGVTGVIAANSAASIVSWMAIRPKLAPSAPSPLALRQAVMEMLQALVFFSGQMLINNCDIVLVKHFFLPTAAGLYAAAALVGRVVYTFSSAVVNSMFPVVAGSDKSERNSLSLMATSFGLVLGIGAVMVVALLLLPSGLWTTFFGAGFEMPGHHGLSYLFALRGVASIIYSLCVVVITYEMSYRIANTSWVQLAFSAAVIGGICRFHSSLEEVILVQLLLMVVLLLAVGVPFLFSALGSKEGPDMEAGVRYLRVLRESSEEEAISEFLRADLYHAVYNGFRDTLRPIINRPNLNDRQENAQRRALLFVRHMALWMELPDDTKWYEITLSQDDLSRIRVFPRAQWRRLARGKFELPFVAERIRVRQQVSRDPFSQKISSICNVLTAEECSHNSILLIGIDDKHPLTIIDGNHRLVAAFLAGRIDQLRFLCGLSPNMRRCCWYNTSVGTLAKYAANLLQQCFRDPEAELIRMRTSVAATQTETRVIPTLDEAVQPETNAGLS